MRASGSLSEPELSSDGIQVLSMGVSQAWDGPRTPPSLCTEVPWFHLSSAHEAVGLSGDALPSPCGR